MTERFLRTGLLAGVLLLPLALVGCGGVSADSTGRALYGSCETCHGASGEGDLRVDAPAIAGMPAWYVSSQLQRFQAGLRGKHPDDREGLRMRAMLLQMLTKAEIDLVASHVAALPPAAKREPALGGDPKVGAVPFQICAACHGQKGEGNQQMNAPPLAGMEDWYVARQLRKFQTGVRGRNPEDVIGMQMAGMAMAVPADDVDDVAAYVHGLSR